MKLIDSEGKTIQLDETVTIRVKVVDANRSDLAIYYLTNGTSLTILSSTKDGTYLQFTTDKLGEFLVGTRTSSSWLEVSWWIILLGILGLSAIITVAIIISKQGRRRKIQRRFKGR